jgi:predicted dehydrogenase
MSAVREIRFGVIGCGFMGREFASAAGRWCHLLDLDFKPVIVAACDSNPAMVEWFAHRVPTVRRTTTEHRALLEDPQVEAIYCAVPHHLHAPVYIDILRAGKHLLGEKPFGIDRDANRAINDEIRRRPDLLVRCSSEFPFFPGAYRLARWIREGRFGKIIEVEAGLWHSSDLNPQKPISWKRQVRFNGEYGCLGDLGMHPWHLPLRFGWKPADVRALLTKIFPERPGPDGKPAPCETWDNATLACQVRTPDQAFPMLVSTKRIAPGHSNTWFLTVSGTACSASFSSRTPKQLRWLPYAPGDEQAERVLDVPYESAYPVVTAAVFEFGFSDAILQMWAAFCDELVHRGAMRQPLGCVTPEEAAQTHEIFTAALESQRTGRTVPLPWSA